MSSWFVGTGEFVGFKQFLIQMVDNVKIPAFIMATVSKREVKTLGLL